MTTTGQRQGSSTAAADRAAAGAEALDRAYRTALLDWLACAAAGSRERAARAAHASADGLEGRLVAAATAGHVLDFDDTYPAGLAHVSAPTAPAALVLGAALGRSVREVLDAYAAGFEAMAALAAANHPALRERGWHPTSVCGVVGSAVAAARLLGLSSDGTVAAVGLALLSASGLRAAFGSDGKSLQVGAAAAAGVRAARLAGNGARTTAHVAAGFEEAYGAVWVEPPVAGRAVLDNWIKAYPCCLQTHAAIDAALASGIALERDVSVVVHPVSLTAADRGPEPADGLEAKFSIAYLTAYALIRGAPVVSSYDSVDTRVRAAAARHVRVVTDAALGESEARLVVDGETLARVDAPVGSPANPMPPERHADKVRALAGTRLDGALDDDRRPAGAVLTAAGLSA